MAIKISSPPSPERTTFTFLEANLLIKNVGIKMSQKMVHQTSQLEIQYFQINHLS